MEKNKCKIGVFDSGIGGLTVLETLIRLLPGEDFYYIADQSHCPYGAKTEEQIAARVTKITRFLTEQGVKAIVIACGTGSLFIDSARAVTDVPVTGVIDPACNMAARVSVNKKIAVLATKFTVNSGAYQRALEAKGITPYALACGEFVDFVERYGPDDPAGLEIVKNSLGALAGSGIDTVMHACTHFSLLEPQMRKVLEYGVNYVACGEAVGEVLPALLKTENLLNDKQSGGALEIYTTGDAENAERSMKWFKPFHAPVKHISVD